VSVKEIINCKNCSLHINQPPLLDNTESADVFWVGLSAVKVDNHITDTPLSNNTKSGNLINTIESTSKDLHFYKTNIVKCLPLENSKIRYPNFHEMSSCWTHIIKEIDELKPRHVFLLGSTVSNFFYKKQYIPRTSLDKNFKYKPFMHGKTYFIPIHHPSYILIYKRKMLDLYISSVSGIFN